MTTEKASGEIISLLSTARTFAAAPRTVEGCDIHQVIKSEERGRDINESCAAMQRTGGVSATAEDYDPRMKKTRVSGITCDVYGRISRLKFAG